jgi:hypothetical protein
MPDPDRTVDITCQPGATEGTYSCDLTQVLEGAIPEGLPGKAIMIVDRNSGDFLMRPKFDSVRSGRTSFNREFTCPYDGVCMSKVQGESHWLTGIPISIQCTRDTYDETPVCHIYHPNHQPDAHKYEVIETSDMGLTMNPLPVTDDDVNLPPKISISFEAGPDQPPIPHVPVYTRHGHLSDIETEAEYSVMLAANRAALLANEPQASRSPTRVPQQLGTRG